MGSLPLAPGPVASPSGLCPPGRCASERSRRVWAGGARGGASPQLCCCPRRCCCHGPAAPKAVPCPQPGGGCPRFRSPDAAPRPWRTSAWSRPQSPALAHEGQPHSRPLWVTVLQVAVAFGLEPLLAGRPVGQTDGCSWAMNGRRAQPKHARKVVAPREAPALHTLSVARRAGGGMGPGNPQPMGVDGGAGAGRLPPRPLSLLSSRPSTESCACPRTCCPQSLVLHLWLMGRSGRSMRSGPRSGTALARDPAAQRRAKCLGN